LTLSSQRAHGKKGHKRPKKEKKIMEEVDREIYFIKKKKKDRHTLKEQKRERERERERDRDRERERERERQRETLLRT